tara:strand:- start:295 stop:498 length:204 start_codon:yes stop_codon:yes gene_type:complete
MIIKKAFTPAPREIVVSANAMNFHRMIRRELLNARRVMNNHELFPSSLNALAALVVQKHGARYNGYS